MTIDQTAAAGTDADHAVSEELVRFLQTRTKNVIEAEQDLFASGLVSSMFAMELVVHLEQMYGIAIVGTHLKLDNFRTVAAMTALVARLRADDAAITG